jgi:beta-fructofuranosidase
MKRRSFLHATALIPFLKPVVAEKISVTVPQRGNGQAASQDFFYKPGDAWAADFIPLYADGEFQLFFLLDWRDEKNHGEGTPWYRVSTRDFVQFTEHGEMLPRGSKEQQDLFVFTGSAIQAKDQFHIFYTGHNPHLQQQGRPLEGVMHAVSNDLQRWEKLPLPPFFSPGGMYEPDDWRDPFVFWNAESREYHMLVAARFKKGIPRRRGLTVLCVSDDLMNWNVAAPFYAPGLYYTHECPDHFRMGDWWYLVFSEFTDLVRTRYRMSRSENGPWIIPGKDDFDGHAYYAAKTASDGERRFMFGWNPTRQDSKDNGSWQWGGNLVVHEIHQQENGILSVGVPATVDAAFGSRRSVEWVNQSGSMIAEKEEIKISSPGSYGVATAGKMPAVCKMETTVMFEKNTRACGLMFRVSDDLEKAYYIRMEPGNNKLVFDMWPRDRSEVSQMVELSREVSLDPGVPQQLRVFVDGNKGVAYLNNLVAMNFRCYDLFEGNWGVFVSEGVATFTKTNIFTR